MLLVIRVYTIIVTVVFPLNTVFCYHITIYAVFFLGRIVATDEVKQTNAVCAECKFTTKHCVFFLLTIMAADSCPGPIEGGSEQALTLSNYGQQCSV